MSSEFPVSITYLSEFKTKSKTRDTQDFHESNHGNDFPMSQFNGESSHAFSQYEEEGVEESFSPKKKKNLRAISLSLLLFGLWATIGTGHLHSELPIFSQVRAQYDQFFASTGSEVTTDDASLLSKNPESRMMTENAVQPSVQPESPSTAIASESLALEKAQESAAKPESNLVPDSVVPPVSNVIPPVPASLSAADVEKLAKSFIDQGLQMNAVEEQLIRLLEANSNPETFKTTVDALERRHQAALQSLKELSNRKKK